MVILNAKKTKTKYKNGELNITQWDDSENLN